MRSADDLPSLDAHAHLRPGGDARDFEGAGAVLAMTLALDEAAATLPARGPAIAVGVGCHPRVARAMAGFDRDRFEELVRGAALVGEVGLDGGSRVPAETQLRVFRDILEVVARRPLPVSIHGYRATGAVLDELAGRPVAAPILHWWTGSAAETSRAVELGCWFSVHSAVARWSIWRTRVPPERLLVESDHGWRDPPAAIPHRVAWVEHLLAQQLVMPVGDVRALAWRNLAAVFAATDAAARLPAELRALLAGG